MLFFFVQFKFITMALFILEQLLELNLFFFILNEPKNNINLVLTEVFKVFFLF